MELVIISNFNQRGPASSAMTIHPSLRKIYKGANGISNYRKKMKMITPRFKNYWSYSVYPTNYGQCSRLWSVIEIDLTLFVSGGGIHQARSFFIIAQSICILLPLNFVTFKFFLLGIWCKKKKMKKFSHLDRWWLFCQQVS